MTLTPPRSLTCANDQTLCGLIRQARRRVVFMAPALSLAVSKALAEKWAGLGSEGVTAIMDVDAETYRLGYGDFDAFQTLQKAAARLGAMITQQPGVRLGLLISDDQTIIWSPHAEMIEAGPKRPEALNAIRLGIPPADVEADVGHGPDGVTSRTVGLDPAEHEEITTVEKSLKNNPPQKFDIVRQVRVFNAFFEFVDFKVTGVLINRKTVKLPSYLMSAVDKKTQEKIHTSFQLLDKNDTLSGQYLMDDRRKIEEKHLRRIASHGLVIRRMDKDAFEADINELKTAVEKFQETLEKKLQDEMDQSRKALTQALLPAIKKTPPEEWTSSCLFKPDKTEAFLEDALKKAFGKAEDLIRPMNVRVTFKGVTYESLQDKQFMADATRAFPDMETLFSENDAAMSTADPPAPQSDGHA